MIRRSLRTFASGSVFAVVASVGCGGAADSGDAAASSDTATAEGAAQPPGEVAGEVELQVTGGPRAGRYTGRSTDAMCAYGSGGTPGWEATLTMDAQDPTSLGRVGIVVPDPKAAAAGTEKFFLSVTFGPVDAQNATHYVVHTSAPDGPSGAGTARLDDRGSMGTATFDAKTPAGVALKGSIKCNGVYRWPGIP